MKVSKTYIPTRKEAPAEAEVISHKLLLRAGLIRKLTSGIYSYLPLGLRVLDKVGRIVREEMDRAGALEVLLPMVQPADLWEETGRWEFYGKELLRFEDRHNRPYCLGPTHEEVITDLVRGEVRSYRHLPITLYQVQTKFRDEVRPRFGLMRGREFVMKDAYSFDRDDAGADISYQAMSDAYHRIFQRLGLRYRAVSADSGSIGGSFSHEFMVLAETGEDTIAACCACEFAANLEKCATPVKNLTAETCAPVAEVATPGKHTVEEVAQFLQVSPQNIMKTMLFNVDGKKVALLLRGDRQLNEVKVKNLFTADSVEQASAEEVQAWTNAPVGFAGPVGLNVDYIYADFELAEKTDWVAGANKAQTHVLHVDLARDVTLSKEHSSSGFADLRDAVIGDPCPLCSAALEMYRGIEVGHVFKLGTKYSKSMNCTYLDEQGKEQIMVMGCYGIGVSRIVAAAIEQNNDDGGIIFSPAIAPYEVAILPLSMRDENLCAKAEEIYQSLQAQGIEVLLDDRDERPGVKFADADLIGYPVQVVLGAKGLEQGVVEVKNRKTGEKGELPLTGFLAAFTAWRQAVHEGWGLPA